MCIGEADQHLLLAILASQPVKVDSTAVAAMLGPACTPRAVEERLKKLKKKAREDGMQHLARDAPKKVIAKNVDTITIDDDSPAPKKRKIADAKSTSVTVIKVNKTQLGKKAAATTAKQRKLAGAGDDDDNNSEKASKEVAIQQKSEARETTVQEGVSDQESEVKEEDQKSEVKEEAQDEDAESDDAEKDDDKEESGVKDEAKE